MCPEERTPGLTVGSSPRFLGFSQILPPSNECRRQQDECDLPEFCDGTSNVCPENVYAMNGLPCDAGNGYCYNGQCPQKEDQCVKMYGSGRSPQNDQSVLKMYGPGRSPQKEDQCVKMYGPGRSPQKEKRNHDLLALETHLLYMLYFITSVLKIYLQFN